jgi:hypothetical protein
MSRLPKRFPAGTVYVVEGRGGQYGRLHVSTRYVIMPSGRRVDIPADLARGPAAGTRRGRLTSLRGQGDRESGAKKSAAVAKKYRVVAGTAMAKQR